MKRFIITEDEKKHIMNLYEETTTKLPEIIKVTLVLNEKEYFVEISEVVKKSTNCEFIGNFRGESKKFTFTWNPSYPDKLSYKEFINFKSEIRYGDISEKAAIQLQNACGNKEFVSTEKGGSSNYV